MNRSRNKKIAVFILATALTTMSVRAEVITGLVAHWPMDEGTGTTVNDIVGTADGTMVNYQASPWLTSPNSVIDGALLTNNIASTRIDTTDEWDFAPALPFSASLWVYRVANTGTTYFNLIGKGEDPGSGRQGWSIGMCNTCGVSNRGFSCERHLNGSSAQNAIDLSGDVPLNQWVHVACTYGGPGTRVRIYRDGVQTDTSSTVTVNILSTTAVLRIGNNYAQTSSFRGRLDEVRLYDRELTAAEVVTLANPCTTAQAGTIKYFTSDNRVRYCNTKYWESTTSRSAGAACAVAEAGKFYFDTTNNNYVFCNGTNLYPMGASSGGGAGCTSPTSVKGKLIFDSTTKYFKYCNGSSWVNVGT